MRVQAKQVQEKKPSCTSRESELLESKQLSNMGSKEADTSPEGQQIHVDSKTEVHYSPAKFPTTR